MKDILCGEGGLCVFFGAIELGGKGTRIFGLVNVAVVLYLFGFFLRFLFLFFPSSILFVCLQLILPLKLL